VTYDPQLATLVESPPSGDDWLHEIKFDGYRIGCRIDESGVSLTTRNGNDWTAQFPEIVKAASLLPVTSAFIDGEVAIMLADGRTSFQALQHALSGSRTRADLVYVVFDLLHLDGDALHARPLEERKERLRVLVDQDTLDIGDASAARRLRFADHVVGNGAALFAEAQRLGLEGIVSKRRVGPHHPGRSRDWTKAKCVQRQDFVIGGFTDQEGSVGALGALLLGQFEDGALVFTGNVGTGFSRDDADGLRRTLTTLEQPTSPFGRRPTGPTVRRAHWVRPVLVCTVRFVEWTDDGRIRHPSFQGLRPTVDAETVRRHV
jgi:bifunctional non-homologous end joining protein LigD